MILTTEEDETMTSYDTRPPAEWPWFLGSILLTPVAFLLAVIAVGAGDGSFIPAMTIFPWGMMTTSLNDAVILPAVLAAIAQFPAYGVLLGLGARFRRLRSTALGLAAAHALAVGVAYAVVPATYHW
jgi:hypothetical protein